MTNQSVFWVFLAFVLLGCGRSGQISSGDPVVRDKSPAIIIKGDQIFVDGKLLWLGDSMAVWKAAILGTPRCSEPQLVVVCKWDDLGVQIGSGQSDMTKVKFININLAYPEDLFSTENELSPKKLFSGYLELDGVAIDSETKYGAIRRNIDPNRNMTCGIRSCTEPTAAFNSGATIYLSLQGSTDQSRLYSFSLSCKSDESCKALIPK